MDKMFLSNLFLFVAVLLLTYPDEGQGYVKLDYGWADFHPKLESSPWERVIPLQRMADNKIQDKNNVYGPDDSITSNIYTSGNTRIPIRPTKVKNEGSGHVTFDPARVDSDSNEDQDEENDAESCVEKTAALLSNGKKDNRNGNIVGRKPNILSSRNRILK